MSTDLNHSLMAEVQLGGHAYVRNLIAAEIAILQGQFNVAKVFRASAHAQRALAMEAARLLAIDFDPTALLQSVTTELERGPVAEVAEATPGKDNIIDAKLAQFRAVREGLQDILQRSMTSLEANNDILESDVAQFLWGCYGCGHIVEGDLPDACPVCGALAIEFEWFGPFYSATPEHLGQLSPAEFITILETIPDQVAGVISNVDDDHLRRKPSEDEWSVKEIVGHILETDILFVDRVKFILESQGIPAIPRTVPPWKLHEGKGYEELSADELIKRLRQARSASLELVRSLTPDQWARRGTILGSATSVLDLGTWLTNHDRGHLAQIRQLCDSE